ncbi:MAG: isopentenyl transferase family protein [bacterium]|nr:isopentenyl transferase family protein [bacterium]
MHKLIAVVGPTGSGKTKLAVELAKKFNGVIISADSRQVYRGLDIGTNKEGAPGRWNEQPVRLIDGIPQLLIDIANPGERFTLNDWLQQASYWLKPIWQVGQLPIVVGGTGLYVTALLEGYQPGGGRGAKNNQPVDFESLILMPDVDREILNQRSNERCARIFDALVAETEKLLSDGVSGEWLDKIGLDYRYTLYCIRGQLSREEAVAQYQAASRAYIRRQITWWRHHGEIVKVTNELRARSKVEIFLKSVA